MHLWQEEVFLLIEFTVCRPNCQSFPRVSWRSGFGVRLAPHHAPIGIEAFEPRLVPIAHVALQKAIGISRPCPVGTVVRAAGEGANHKGLMTWSRGLREAAQAGMGPLRRSV